MHDLEHYNESVLTLVSVSVVNFMILDLSEEMSVRHDHAQICMLQEKWAIS